MVNHGHINVNGRRVTIASYRLRKGDVVEVRPKARDFTMLQWNLDVLDRTPPAWLEKGDGLQMVVRELPIREQIDVPVREQLIVELYSK
jgi:small subunit ribosomal protein S4